MNTARQALVLLAAALTLSAEAYAAEERPQPALEAASGPAVPSDVEIAAAAKAAKVSPWAEGSRVDVAEAVTVEGFTVYDARGPEGHWRGRLARRATDGRLWWLNKATVPTLLAEARTSPSASLARLPQLMSELGNAVGYSLGPCTKATLNKRNVVRFQCPRLVYMVAWIDVIAPATGPVRIVQSSPARELKTQRLLALVEEAKIQVTDDPRDYLATSMLQDDTLDYAVVRVAAIDEPWRSVVVASSGTRATVVDGLKGIGHVLHQIRNQPNAARQMPALFIAMTTDDPRLHSALTTCDDAKQTGDTFTFTCHDQSYYGGFDVTLDASGGLRAFWTGTKSELSWRPVTSI